MRTSVICRNIRTVRGYRQIEVLKGISTILILFVFSQTQGQEITVINRFNGPDEKLAPESYVLKNVSEHTYIINEYELSNTGQRSRLDAMISYGLRSYIDNQYHVFDGRIESIDGPEMFLKSSSDIVKNAIWIHDLSFGEKFPGFSDFIAVKVKKLKEIDGNHVLQGDADMDQPNGKNLGLYTFQRMVYDLKKSAEMEVALFLNTYLPNTDKRGYDESDLPYLQEKDFDLSPSRKNMDELDALKPDIDLFDNFDSKKKKKKKRDNTKQGDLAPFTEKVVELLEQNNKILAHYNDRFENLQDQINDLRESRPENNSGLRDEIAELRNMIKDLAEGKTIKETDGTNTKMISDKELTILFEKNAHELTLSQKAQLNAVKMELRKNPGYSALITGYADKTGNSEINAWISKKRAAAVRNYLQSQGIPIQRLIINFLGDAESDAPNPADRKVTIAFLENSASRN